MGTDIALSDAPETLRVMNPTGSVVAVVCAKAGAASIAMDATSAIFLSSEVMFIGVFLGDLLKRARDFLKIYQPHG
jgi:hypothetical protein